MTTTPSELREEVEALLALTEKVHSPNNGVIATLCRTWLAVAASGEAVAWCQPNDPRATNAFSWPGTARNPAHTMPLYAAPQPASGEALEVVEFAAVSASLMHGFMLDCNAIGPHGAGENLARGIKQYLDASLPPPPAARGAGG